ncbi:MAG: L-lactate dehydrogenase [Candidatus Auribacterota bacterium]|jgi:L-lactate dehydrogenase|uniref:L-lactate dehydrogenase n=1 Tax=Candidatus Auribacter fodinae TaxID=2093366 RepID=A0A3A4R2G0_9BACT|nr:MAG: L-lactate dehydrogenase [Candidatus Auribacter fodinae]
MKTVDVVINKVVIIGTGFVGSSIAFALMMSGRASEIVLIDANRKKAEGEMMDLNHGSAFTPPVDIYVGDYKDCKNADIIVIAAGANQKPGETRIDLVHKNTAIFKEIIPQITAVEKNAIMLVVTNPVDILTYVTLKVSRLLPEQVIGSGTVLDTARFRYLLSEHCGVDPRHVHAYIIGEHGDTEVPVWSRVIIGVTPLEHFCKLCHKKCNEEVKNAIFHDVKNAAYQIIERKGATYYAVALGVLRIIESILRNESSLLTISSYLDNYYGINDVCLSVPSLLRSEGIQKHIELPLNDEEHAALQRSADEMKNIIAQLDI